MNRIVNRYIDQLAIDLANVMFSIDPTIEASRFRERSDEGIRYGVKVSLLRDEAYAEWSVFDAYRYPTHTRLSRYTRLTSNARKYFSLTHEGNQQLKEVAVNFARETKADIVSDFPVLIGITSYEPLNERNPRSTFVGDVSRYARALSQAAHQPISIPPTPKPTPISTPSHQSVTPISPTQIPTYTTKRAGISPPSTKVEPTHPKRDPFYLFRWEAPNAWRLRDMYGDWKAIPIEELERIGWTRRMDSSVYPPIVYIQKKKPVE